MTGFAKNNCLANVNFMSPPLSSNFLLMSISVHLTRQLANKHSPVQIYKRTKEMIKAKELRYIFSPIAILLINKDLVPAAAEPSSIPQISVGKFL